MHTLIHLVIIAKLILALMVSLFAIASLCFLGSTIVALIAFVAMRF